MKREMTCIACPIGCRLTVEQQSDGNEIIVTGNKCRKGEEYGREEILSPSRVVTATVAVLGVDESRVPVKTSKPLPKPLIGALLSELYRIELEPPIDLGRTIISSFRESGVDVVITRTIAGSAER